MFALPPRDRALADAALARLGIAELAHRSVLALSGGERQLPMVAHALAHEAPVLCLDEPTAHLELPHQLRVLGLARELALDGRVVLAGSHHLSRFACDCDRLSLLAGRRIETGPAAEILRPDHVRAAFAVEVDLSTPPPARWWGCPV